MRAFPTHPLTAKTSARLTLALTMLLLAPSASAQQGQPPPKSGPSTKTTPTGQEMEFSDQPHFSVAGVTDWTAAGGHGSDVTLRTSESLTDATTTLKPAAAAPAPNKASNRGPKPGDSATLYAQALAYQSAGKLEEARETIGRELALDKNADAYRLAGILDEKRGDPLSAVREFEQAASLDPSEENEFAWGSELLEHRAIWQAEQIFRKGAAAYPNSLRMNAGLGAALFAGARYEDAALQFCKASDLDPADTKLYLLIGKIAVAAPKPLACVEPKLTRFVQLHPDSSAANYFYAMALLKAQPGPDAMRPEQAEKFLNKAVSLDPKCSEAHLELGILAAARHDNQSAIRHYLRAIEAGPQLADAHYRLGIAYDRVGETAKAEQEFALHKQLEQEQAEATERQRKAVKQFLFAKPDVPAVSTVK